MSMVDIKKENILIRRLKQQDAESFQALIQVFRGVFETENYVSAQQTYLARLLNRPDFICYIVQIENEIVGGLTAYELQKYYAQESEVFIYDIAIKPEFRRRGLGKQLLLALQEYCRENGINVFFVAAHAADKHAVKFYKSSGGEAEKVIHFNYILNQV